MKRAIFVACVLVAGCGYDGRPLYPETPKNEITFHRGIGGVAFRLTNATDTDADATDVKYGVGEDGQTKQISIGHVTFKSAQSKNQEQLIQWMSQYAGQQAGYAGIRSAEWAGATGFVSQLLAGVAPIAQAYIGMRGNVAAQKALRPSAVSEIVRGITGGQLDAMDVIPALPPELRDDVKAAFFRAAVLPVAPSPSASSPSPGVEIPAKFTPTNTGS